MRINIFQCLVSINSLTVTTATGAALWASELENMGKAPTAVPQTDANATGKQEEVEVQLPQPAVNDKKKEL